MKPRWSSGRVPVDPGGGLPARPGAPEFRPEPDETGVLDIFRRVHQGSLDAHAQRAVAASGLDAAAAEDLEILRLMPARARGRLARTDGEARRADRAQPQRHRSGHRLRRRAARAPRPRVRLRPARRGDPPLVAEGADRIVANTDVSNLPMAATFAKAGEPGHRSPHRPCPPPRPPRRPPGRPGPRRKARPGGRGEAEVDDERTSIDELSPGRPAGERGVIHTEDLTKVYPGPTSPRWTSSTSTSARARSSACSG